MSEPSLDRAMLEYHLHTLTSRSQEKDFEHFARHLAQKEICSNLIPQTGPTGGGDSKVDTETYPVSDDISLTWYTGIGRQAAEERWAFAISAKEEWRPKVRADVEKIASVERGYTKAFFVTNQYVKDKDRAAVEDELRKKHNLDVRIFDRTWILDKVFTNHHEDLAVEHLGLQASLRTSHRKGPRDLQREQDLAEVEARIERAAQERLFGITFVEDCIEAAETARDLELPRTEVEGRFDRAERVVAQYGTLHQRFICAYDRAWTAFWWYEDYPGFNRHYGVAEQLIKDSRNAYELELLTNLWSILFSLVKRGNFEPGDANLPGRTNDLETRLERLAQETDRPSTSLQARSLRELVRLLQSTAGNVQAICDELSSIIRESSGLVGFPLKSLAETLIELGEFLGERQGYDELFETIIEVQSQQHEEVEAARLLLKRGLQRLEAGQPAEAIRSFGRALARLHKHESRHDLVRALAMCAVAYEQIGLFWAARGALLSAASIATNDFWSYEEITMQQAACYRQLKWLELRLGRLPQILVWHELDRAVRFLLAQQGYHSADQQGDEINFDAILGILLLGTDTWDLKRLTKLPDALDRIGLYNAAMALKYALGDEASVAEDLKASSVGPDELSEHFRLWRDQPVGEEIARQPQCYDTQTVVLRSRVLGCRVTVESESDLRCITLAESLLGILESLLATGIVDKIVAREPTLAISVRSSDFAEKPFRFSMSDVDGRPRVDIQCRSFDWSAQSVEEQTLINQQIRLLVCDLLARVFFLGDVEEKVTKLFRDDRALERSISFTGGFAALRNVLGDSPRTSLAAWINSENLEYPLKRSEPWDAALPRNEAEAMTPDRASEPSMVEARGRSAPLDTGRISHSEIETVSLIRIALWDRAKWSATAFFGTTDHSEPPVLAPIFRNAKAADEILRLLREELGERDVEEKLRVTIIRCIRKDRPLDYRVVIGVNPQATFGSPGHRLAVMPARVHTMTPTSHENLDRFMSSYRVWGFYGFTYGTFDANPAHPRLDMKYIIAKSKLFLRMAWEIGVGDMDSCGIQDDDEPIIPADRPDAPVLALLAKRRKRV